MRGDLQRMKEDILSTVDRVYAKGFERGYEKAQNKLSEKVETNIYDREETHERCTVQILSNSVTGEQSIGWTPEETGEWIVDFDGDHIECPNCEEWLWFNDSRDLILSLNTYKYCPYCGMRMVLHG